MNVGPTTKAGREYVAAAGGPEITKTRREAVAAIEAEAASRAVAAALDALARDVERLPVERLKDGLGLATVGVARRSDVLRLIREHREAAGKMEGTP